MKFILTCGGTAGHINPALAIAGRLRELMPDCEILFIGAEGTLGIITAAVMKLVPAPRAHATATLATRSLADALVLLNRMQEATGGRVEAFEFMPRTYSERLREAPAGTKLRLGLRRGGKNIEVDLVLADRIPARSPIKR